MPGRLMNANPHAGDVLLDRFLQTLRSTVSNVRGYRVSLVIQCLVWTQRQPISGDVCVDLGIGEIVQDYDVTKGRE